MIPRLSIASCLLVRLFFAVVIVIVVVVIAVVIVITAAAIIVVVKNTILLNIASVSAQRCLPCCPSSLPFSCRPAICLASLPCSCQSATSRVLASKSTVTDSAMSSQDVKSSPTKQNMPFSLAAAM